MKNGLLCILLLTIICGGCGMVPISPEFIQPLVSTHKYTQLPPTKLVVQDKRSKKIFYKSVLGEGTDSGSGSILRLTQTPVQLFYDGFNHTMPACGYNLHSNSDLTYEVKVEEFLVIQNDNSTAFNTSISLTICLLNKNETIIEKKFTQTDQAPLPFGKPMQNVITPLLSQSLSNIINKATHDNDLRKALINENVMMVDSQAWQRAKAVNTHQSYSNYLNDHPDDQWTKQAQDLMASIEQKDYQQAKAKQSLHAYKQFLLRYPDSSFHQIAAADREILSWQQANKLNSEDKYLEYLKEYPQGKYAKRAQENIEMLREDRAWKTAKQGNVIEAYEIYLKKYPNGKHTAYARQNITDIEWQTTQEQDNVEAYRHFVEKHSDSKYTNDAQAWLKVNDKENREWEQVNNSENVELLLVFIQKYPHGTHANKAQAQIDRLLWQQANQNDGLPAYETYLNGCPTGNFVNEATFRIEVEKLLSKYDIKQRIQAYKNLMNNPRRMPAYKNLMKNPRLKPQTDWLLGRLEKLEAQAWQETIDLAQSSDAEGKYQLANEHLWRNDHGHADEVIRWLKQAADDGHQKAQSLLGNIYYHKFFGIEQDYGQSALWLKKAAEQGHIESQYLLGQHYHYGLGTDKDPHKAFQWYLKAAQQGQLMAMYEVSEIYEQGLTVNQDDEKAYDWRSKAAKKGHDLAQEKLADQFCTGKGVTQNNKESFYWYTRAARPRMVSIPIGESSCFTYVKNGDIDAIYQLGQCYENGKGTEKDKTKALEYYSIAADAGNAKAQYKLAMLYLLEPNEQRDMVEAYKWLILSSEQDYPPAINEIGAFRQNMKVNDILLAEERSQTFKVKVEDYSNASKYNFIFYNKPKTDTTTYDELTQQDIETARKNVITIPDLPKFTIPDLPKITIPDPPRLRKLDLPKIKKIDPPKSKIPDTLR